MKSDNISEAVSYEPGFRIVNLAVTVPTDDGEYVADRIAVEHYPRNTSYGCCIDRDSRITIIAPSNMVDPGLSHFCFYLAYFGQFNYISREIGERAPYKSYYAFNSEDDVEGIKEYAADLKRLMAKDGAWTLTVLVASGALDPPYPTNIHLSIGGKKGDTRTSGEDLFVKDSSTYEAFYNTLEKTLASDLNLTLDHQQFHNSHSPNNFLRKLSLTEQANHIIMRIEWKQLLWSQKRLKLARDIAESLCSAILDVPLPPIAPELKVKAIGYEGYECLSPQ